MSDTKRDLAKTSEELMHQVDVLRELERQKRQEPISTPRFHQLAEDVTAKSREVMRTSLAEEVLGDRAERGDETIDAVVGPPDRAADRPGA